MIRHQVALHNLATPVLRQLPEHLSKMTPWLTKNPLLAPLRDVHHMVFAVPMGVTQALVLFHRESSSLGRDFRFTRLRYRSNLGESPGRAGGLPQ
jgi:hypothetical protein